MSEAYRDMGAAFARIAALEAENVELRAEIDRIQSEETNRSHAAEKADAEKRAAAVREVERLGREKARLADEVSTLESRSRTFLKMEELERNLQDLQLLKVALEKAHADRITSLAEELRRAKDEAAETKRRLIALMNRVEEESQREEPATARRATVFTKVLDALRRRQ